MPGGAAIINKPDSSSAQVVGKGLARPEANLVVQGDSVRKHPTFGGAFPGFACSLNGEERRI